VIATRIKISSSGKSTVQSRKKAIKNIAEKSVKE
jgi:hypothetical protein